MANFKIWHILTFTQILHGFNFNPLKKNIAKKILFFQKGSIFPTY